MEQDVRDNDFTLLKFKYYNFYDLNPKVNNMRNLVNGSILLCDLLCCIYPLHLSGNILTNGKVYSAKAEASGSILGNGRQ